MKINYVGSIARNVLPIRDIGKADYDDYKINGTSVARYGMYQIATGWYIGKKRKKSYANEEKVARQQIARTEDALFLLGNEYLGRNFVGDLSGVMSTQTVRHDLLNAIEEFRPNYVITSSIGLNLKNVEIYKCDLVPQYVHYLGIKDKSIAEFIISEDITEEEYPTDSSGKIWHELHEWVTVEVHKPDSFVKVSRK
jgi:hypothetical protein